MSISRQNLSIVIVTLKSEDVINQCLNSINKEIPIFVIENSSNLRFKENLEANYQNVTCVLSNENLGMGRGNNFGINLVKTDYVLILNPDVVLMPNTIDELISASKYKSNFSILSPISDNSSYPNYKLVDRTKFEEKENLPFLVKSVDGYAMLFNINKINMILKSETHNQKNNYFDESFFMYLENDDLCKRIIDKGEKIFIVPNAKITHLGAKAVSEKYKDEVEFSRNWHWIWSKFYFNKKHHGLLKAILQGLPQYVFSILKFLFYKMTRNKTKQKIYFNRASGFFNALIGKPSWYRPILDE
jgi:N-acetylglucosaminyl-diphospho-decaprenol L-rhamnosyltransferase